jgi:hypothetical protein
MSKMGAYPIDQEQRLLSQDEAAMEALLDLSVVRLCAKEGLVPPLHGYDDADLAELRRIRRLIDDLGLDQLAIEVVVRMRRQLLALREQVRRLEAELRYARRAPASADYAEADWWDSAWPSGAQL